MASRIGPADFNSHGVAALASVVLESGNWFLLPHCRLCVHAALRSSRNAPDRLPACLPACLPTCCCSGKALDCLRHATHVLSTVPPDADNDIDPVIMAHAQQVQRLPMDGWAVGVPLAAELHAASLASGSRAAAVRS